MDCLHYLINCLYYHSFADSAEPTLYASFSRVWQARLVFPRVWHTRLPQIGWLYKRAPGKLTFSANWLVLFHTSVRT